MKRRTFIFSLLAASALPGQLLASPIQDFLLKELRAQGYTEFTVSTTWLGRLRILAISPKYRREIIANPRTGEILRDYWVLIGEGAGSSDILDPEDNNSSGKRNKGGSGGGSGSGSGSGSGGSGSGGSGSGGSGSGQDDDDESDSDSSSGHG
jgi:uncharacterized membrane protein YgcG